VSPFQQAVPVILSGHLGTLGWPLAMLGISGEGGSAASCGRLRSKIAHWRVVLGAIAATRLCALDLSGLSTDGQLSMANIVFFAFHVCGWIVGTFHFDLDRRCRRAAFNAGGGFSGRSLSLQGHHQNKISMHLRQQGWQSRFMVGFRVQGCRRGFRDCGEKGNAQRVQRRGGQSAVAEGYGPPSSVVSPSARLPLGA